MFAPKHHAATKHVVPVRKELAVRTIFNFLGPLTNPAGAKRQLLGVSDRTYQETIAEALIGLGCERALVVSADDGMDELSINSAHPGDRGRRRRDRGVVRRAPRSSGCRGRPDRGDRRRGAGRERQGRRSRCSTGESGPAAATSRCSTAARRSSSPAAPTTSPAGIEKAREAVASGAAKDVLDKLVARTGELAG